MSGVRGSRLLALVYLFATANNIRHTVVRISTSDNLMLADNSNRPGIYSGDTHAEFWLEHRIL
jgi:hypothetical protein